MISIRVGVAVFFSVNHNQLDGNRPVSVLATYDSLVANAQRGRGLGRRDLPCSRPRFFVFRSIPTGPNKRLKALLQEMADLVQRMEAMLDAADKEGRDLTADEEKDYQELETSLPALDRRINREQTFLNTQASQQPIRDLNRSIRQEAAARIGQVHDNWHDDPMCGYERPRDFLLDVIDAGQGGDITPQLRFLAAAGSDEQGGYSDPHGGFFVPEGSQCRPVSPKPGPVNA